MARDIQRGQSGLDRLAVFVGAVLALLLVAPTVLGFVGIDVREQADRGHRGEVKLTVLDAEGDAVDGNRTSVGTVRLVVVNTGDAETDMSEFTAIWMGNGSYDLVPAGSEGDGDGGDGDGEFGVGRLGTDESESGTVLRDIEDRGVLTFDLGTDDVEGVAEFGSRLRPGETVTVTLVAADGTTVQRELSVPETLPAEGSVDL